jgi:hypothetical protein
MFGPIRARKATDQQNGGEALAVAADGDIFVV